MSVATANDVKNLAPGVIAKAEPIKVPQTLSQSQVKSFVDDGFLVAENLVSPVELEELKADLYKLARGGYPCDSLKPLPSTMSDADVLANILCIHQPHVISPVMRKYATHPKICGVLSQVTGAHLAHWDGSVKCMQTMLFAKPPQFQGQAWHQDEIYIPTRDRSLIGAWIAIDDAMVENGCLFVVPGSHQTGYLYPQRPHNRPEEFDVSDESFGFDESKEVAVEVKAGTVVFFNGHLLHRSLKNRSAKSYRRVLVSHYMNAWSMLPWSLCEGERVATADRRNVIPVSGIDPYAWKGYTENQKDVYLRKHEAIATKK